MSMNKLFHRPLSKRIAGYGMAAAMVLSGCSDTKAEIPETAVTAKQLSNTKGVTFVIPGQSKFVNVSDQNKEWLTEELPLVDHMYEKGPEDDTAPVISVIPQRFRSDIVLRGKYPELAQDAACDTLRIEDPDTTNSIGALALGGDEHGVLLSWPMDGQGEPFDYAYLCVFKDMQPKEDGVVVFAQTEPR